jgi:hypothetical protein
MRSITAKLPGVHANSNAYYIGRWRLNFIRRMLELRAAQEADECPRVTIAFDDVCRHDPADVMHADHIRRHSLIDDNPCSG